MREPGGTSTSKKPMRLVAGLLLLCPPPCTGRIRAAPSSHAAGALQEVDTVWSRITDVFRGRGSGGAHGNLWLYAPPVTPAGAQRLRVCRPEDGYDFARLEWRACAQCRLGLVSQIRVTAAYRGRRYATRMLLRAVHGCEEYTWSTTRQSAQGLRFFPVAGAAVGVEFSPRACQCDHMRSASALPGRERAEAAPR
ncbi:hypothetical protein [Streptomyces luteosporeus]